ncbi:DUF11 domain-containing protein [Porphyrobacter sp. AAP82]|uniref:DUF11 domain-containing protein n=1 Tax=Porphyrobacter sp. AAP82 TaxID=1248917 RepID=UPI0012DCC3CD|nr:DUF11 domain-containing protein [Porphyrobacter sp. AAP82]
MLPAPAIGQLRSLRNPSFEANDPQGPGAPNWQIFTGTAVPGWSTTTNEIELWDSNYEGVPAYDGVIFAEMNANVNGTFYQNICLINGEPFGWTFAHRARAGGAATQTVRFQVAGSTGTLIQTLATQASTTANRVWNVNTGTATYTGASGLQRVQFTTSDPGSYGNFLDAIQLTLRPFVQFSAASGTGPESIAGTAVPTLLVTGQTRTALPVTITITGGTAVRGTDYTTPGGGASFTVTIPAGTYYNTAIPLGIAVVDDTALEGSETITYAIATGTSYTPAHTTTCGAAAQTTGSYTITDNDARVTLRKQWLNALPGDDANLVVARGTTAIETFASDAGAAGEIDTDPTPTPVVIGETVSLSETLPATNAGAYQQTLACTGAADTVLVDGLTIGAGETAIVCTFTNTRLVPVVVSKSSVVLADGTGGANPKAIPGATVRYCIAVSNPGTLPATQVSVVDNLPAGILYIPGTSRTGTTCTAATTIEDDNASGTDESDPYGTAFSGSTLTGSAPSLDPGAGFAITFSAGIN